MPCSQDADEQSRCMSPRSVCELGRLPKPKRIGVTMTLAMGWFDAAGESTALLSSTAHGYRTLCHAREVATVSGPRARHRRRRWGCSAYQVQDSSNINIMSDSTVHVRTTCMMPGGVAVPAGICHQPHSYRLHVRADLTGGGLRCGRPRTVICAGQPPSPSCIGLGRQGMGREQAEEEGITQRA